MVIDTSSLVCIILGEPEADQHARALVSQPGNSISAATWFEASMVVASRRGEIGTAELARLLALAKAEIVPVDAKLAQLAFDAWLRFGKGRHPASLNFGDCFSYALAKLRGEPSSLCYSKAMIFLKPICWPRYESTHHEPIQHRTGRTNRA